HDAEEQVEDRRRDRAREEDADDRAGNRGRRELPAEREIDAALPKVGHAAGGRVEEHEGQRGADGLRRWKVIAQNQEGYQEKSAARTDEGSEGADGEPEPDENGPIGECHLPDARPVGREIGDLLVGDRAHQGLQRLEVLVAGASPVGLEEQHLVAEIPGRLAREIGDTFGWIPLARDAVATRALDGRGSPALDLGGTERDGRWRTRLSGEVRRNVVDAELEHHL